MKLVVKDGRRYILRFDFDEEFISTFKEFCEKEGIEGGFFVGLGAASVVDLQSFNLDTEKYSKQSFKETLEVANLTGNISKKENETVIHAHGTLGRENFETLSGHVSKLIVSATLEISLIKLDGKIERKFNNHTGLNLIN